MKICIKCKTEYPITRKYFNVDKRHTDGLESRCRKCRNEYAKTKRKTENGKSASIRYNQKYYNTLNGYLRHVYCDIKQRCYNENNSAYEQYGGNGVELRFTFNEFRDYIKKLRINIRGLQIHRMKKHYELNNITFLTKSEHSKKHGRGHR